MDLEAAGQSHLLRFVDELDSQQKQQLLAQISQIDFDELAKLCEPGEEKVDWREQSAKASPPVGAVELGKPHPKYSSEEAIAAGEAALKAGKVAVILVAGGQGTRLGFDQPKGMFPIGPISDRTLFEMHCDRLLAVMERYSVSIPFYVMTSPATDAATRAFFAANERLGLREDQLRIFCQGTMPAVDAETGKVLMASKDSLALSPDGHGGMVAALEKNGCLQQCEAEGIEYYFYAQVDNPLVQLCDPEFLGYHILTESEMSTQVVRKRFATERVGNVVAIDGKTQIIEYSDLPDEFAEQTNADGSLKLWAGNIAVHVLDRSFLQSVVGDAQGLVFHRASKKVPFVNETGELVAPQSPNAIKFERFIFDLLPLARYALVSEGLPSQVFAPVKNADGAEVDTPSLAKQAILDLHRSWLEAAGAKLADGVDVEIHPGWALDAAAVREKIESGTEFSASTFLA